jgi:hypothetical protein
LADAQAPSTMRPASPAGFSQTLEHFRFGNKSSTWHDGGHFFDDLGGFHHAFMRFALDLYGENSWNFFSPCLVELIS